MCTIFIKIKVNDNEYFDNTLLYNNNISIYYIN